MAIAATMQEGQPQRQPVFRLLRRALQGDLEVFVAGGGCKIDRWLDRHGCVDVVLDDASAFFNATRSTSCVRSTAGPARADHCN